MLNRGSAARLLAAAALCAVAGHAAAAPRVAIAGVRNDSGGAVAAGLAKAVCGDLECVDAALVHAGKRIDFATARRNGVDAILYGTVVQRGGARILALALLRDSFKPAKTWSLPVEGRGAVSGGTVAADVAALLEPAPGRPAPAAVAARPPPAAEPAVVVGPGPSTAGVGSSPAPAPAAPGRSPRAEPPGGGEPALAVRRFAIDVGAHVVQRKLTYSGATVASPLGFSANSVITPALRVEVAPLAGAAERWYAGTLVFGSYSRSVGFRTEDTTSGNTLHDTTLSALEAGAGLRFRPIPSARATLLARASYRVLSAKVSPKGSIRGLPDTDLAGPSVGVDLEVPVGRRLAVLAGGAYTRWTRANDLVGAGYFPDGSAWALDGSLGFSALVLGPLSVRALATYARTSYSLSGASTYVATGATDRYVGGSVMARVVF